MDGRRWCDKINVIILNSPAETIEEKKRKPCKLGNCVQHNSAYCFCLTLLPLSRQTRDTFLHIIWQEQRVKGRCGRQSVCRNKNGETVKRGREGGREGENRESSKKEKRGRENRELWNIYRIARDWCKEISSSISVLCHRVASLRWFAVSSVIDILQCFCSKDAHKRQSLAGIYVFISRRLHTQSRWKKKWFGLGFVGCGFSNLQKEMHLIKEMMALRQS